MSALASADQESKGSYEERFIVGFLSCDPRVERVLVSRDAEALHVWTVVNHASQSDLRQLFELEGKLLDRFPSVAIDFHVIDRRDAPSDNLIPGARELKA